MVALNTRQNALDSSSIDLNRHGRAEIHVRLNKREYESSEEQGTSLWDSHAVSDPLSYRLLGLR
jgi:hypothetical protein